MREVYRPNRRRSTGPSEAAFPGFLYPPVTRRGVIRFAARDYRGRSVPSPLARTAETAALGELHDFEVDLLGERLARSGVEWVVTNFTTAQHLAQSIRIG
jgi:hypothetical protein